MTEEAPEPPARPMLKDARRNFWYVLMTVAGEQAPDARGDRYDEDRHAGNRRYFNGWMAQTLSDEDKRKLIDAKRATEEDLAPLKEDEKTEIQRAFTDRRLEPRPIDPDVARPDVLPFALADSEITEVLICRGFVFSGDALFQNTSFSGDACFRDATFLGKTHFHDARFRNASFEDDASFQNATFSGDATFQNARFRNADFQNAAFSGDAAFQNATFSGDANFSDATFKGKTTLVHTGFENWPPKFFNAALHEDTDFTDVGWPAVPKNPKDATNHRRRYERLKQLMDSQKKFFDEHRFHRLALHCREVEDGWRSFSGVGSRLFRYMSDYGWSIGRPLCGLMITFLCGWVLIFIAEYHAFLTGARAALPDPELELWQALGLSFSNTFSLLGLGRTFFQEELTGLTPTSEIVSGVQFFLGPLFLFLLGLALRNRFRIR